MENDEGWVAVDSRESHRNEAKADDLRASERSCTSWGRDNGTTVQRWFPFSVGKGIRENVAEFVKQNLFRAASVLVLSENPIGYVWL